jgi:hypothetical protein
MKQRGRKSAESRSVVVTLVQGTPPAPPDELTPAQADDWRMFVGQMPSDWFRGAAGALLCGLVRHVGYSRLVGKWLTEAAQETPHEGERLDRLNKLSQMHEREGRAVIALMRALRLTPRSRYAQGRAHTAAQSIPPGPRPWETGNDDDAS